MDAAGFRRPVTQIPARGGDTGGDTGEAGTHCRILPTAGTEWQLCQRLWRLPFISPVLLQLCQRSIFSKPP